MTTDAERDWVAAVMASDYDGCLHLVALTDDIEDWAVTVTLEDGSVDSVAMKPATGFYYYPALAGRPSWFVDYGATWELRVAGRPVHRLRGTRQGIVPEETEVES